MIFYGSQNGTKTKTKMMSAYPKNVFSIILFLDMDQNFRIKILNDIKI
jgi:hypothetical protein